MINKQNGTKPEKEPDTGKEPGFTDTARMDVQCHLVIKDKDTNKVLVNKRG